MKLYRKGRRCYVKNGVVWIGGIVSLYAINGDGNVNAAISGSKGVYRCLRI